MAHRFSIPAGLLVCSGLVVAACGGGGGSAVRPNDFKAKDALGGMAAKCTGTPKFARPFTVDLDADTRTDLEARMRANKGVVVVSYDCVNLRVLGSCSVAAGSYDFAAVDLKEDLVQLKGMDELKGNLPIGAAKLSAEVQAGRSIDIALVRIGQSTTTVGKVMRSDLHGECEGATHFLQRASLGAFSVATGSIGKVASTVEIFSKGAAASSGSERKASLTDGSLDACKKSEPDATSPTPNCRAPLTVDLLAIVDTGGSSTTANATAASSTTPASKKPTEGVAVEENPCREEYKLVDGVCSKRTDAAHLCDPRDESDCQAQCEKGSAGSCTNAGALITNRAWKITWKTAKEEARPYFKKACDKGDLRGCAGLVRTTFPEPNEAAGKLAQAKELMALDKKACDAGVGMACFDLGTYHGDVYEGLAFTDKTTSLKYFDRACSLGAPNACNTAGLLHNDHDPEKATSLYIRGCEGGDAFVCNQLSMRLVGGWKGYPKDATRGEALAKKACEMNIEQCGSSAENLHTAGKDSDAFGHAKKGCEDPDPRTDLDEGDKGRAQSYRGSACKLLSDYYAEGTGTTRDATKAAATLKVACNLGDRRACYTLNPKSESGSSPPPSAKPKPKATPKKK